MKFTENKQAVIVGLVISPLALLLVAFLSEFYYWFEGNKLLQFIGLNNYAFALLTPLLLVVLIDKFRKNSLNFNQYILLLISYIAGFLGFGFIYILLVFRNFGAL